MNDRADIAPEDIAEYVLGTLDSAQRQDIVLKRLTDDALNRRIAEWENLLAPLNQAIPQAKPSAHLFTNMWRRLDRLGFADDQRPRACEIFFQWQTYAVATTIACAILAAHLIVGLPDFNRPRFVSVLQADVAAPLFVADLDEKTATLSVRALTAAAPANKDYELWITMAGENTARPLGVLRGQDRKHITFAGVDPARLHDARLAVSLEPSGGSPTGVVTGPIIVEGIFVRSDL